MTDRDVILLEEDGRQYLAVSPLGEGRMIPSYEANILARGPIGYKEKRIGEEVFVAYFGPGFEMVLKELRVQGVAIEDRTQGASAVERLNAERAAAQEKGGRAIP